MLVCSADSAGVIKAGDYDVSPGEMKQRVGAMAVFSAFITNIPGSVQTD